MLICVVLCVKCFYGVISCSLSLLRLRACIFCVLTLCVFGFLLWVLQPSVVGYPLFFMLKERNIYKYQTDLWYSVVSLISSSWEQICIYDSIIKRLQHDIQDIDLYCWLADRWWSLYDPDILRKNMSSHVVSVLSLV